MSESTRDLLQHFLGEWEQFMKRYEASTKEIKAMIGKIDNNTKNIAKLEGWRGSHEKHHAFTYRLLGIIATGASVAVGIWRLLGK